MLTSFDKAIAAIIGGIGTIAASYGFDLGLTPEMTTALATVISGALVWLVPNKGA